MRQHGCARRLLQVGEVIIISMKVKLIIFLMDNLLVQESILDLPRVLTHSLMLQRMLVVSFTLRDPIMMERSQYTMLWIVRRSCHGAGVRQDIQHYRYIIFLRR
jgi:hypothetical protein